MDQRKSHTLLLCHSIHPAPPPPTQGKQLSSLSSGAQAVAVHTKRQISAETLDSLCFQHPVGF